MILAEIVHQTTSFTQTGIGIGSALAIVCSWDRNRSILWAILAGIFSWFYVIYFAVTRDPAPPRPRYSFTLAEKEPPRSNPTETDKG